MSFSLWTPVLSGAIFSSPSVAAFLFLVFLMLAATWLGTLVTVVAITWDGCRRASRTATNVSIFPECEYDILRTLELLLSALTLLQWCTLRILAGQMDGDRFPATAKWVLDRVNTVYLYLYLSVTLIIVMASMLLRFRGRRMLTYRRLLSTAEENGRDVSNQSI